MRPGKPSPAHEINYAIQILFVILEDLPADLSSYSSVVSLNDDSHVFDYLITLFGSGISFL